MTVATATALEQWVEARSNQQRLEKESKAYKKQADGIVIDAQEEALKTLAEINELQDAGPVSLANAKVKTFEFNPLYKVQVSFKKELLPSDDLTAASDALRAEQETLEKANEAEIKVLLAEKEVIEAKLASLRTSPKVAELQEQMDELAARLTVPVVKSLSLKAA